MSSSSDDEMEIVYDASQDTTPLTEDQIRRLDEMWPIFTLYNQAKINWIGSVLKIPPAKISAWDAARRQQRRVTSNEPPQGSGISNSETPRQGSSSSQGPPAPVSSSHLTANANQGTSAAAQDELHASNVVRPEEEEDDTDPSGSEDELEFSDDDDENNSLSFLHNIFPRVGETFTSYEFSVLFKEKLQKRLKKNKVAYNFFLFVDSALPGGSAEARLESLMNVTHCTCIPMWIGNMSPNVLQMYIQQHFQRGNAKSRWKYLRFFDMYKLREDNHAIIDLKNANSTSQYRKFGFLTLVKLLASRVNQSRMLPRYTMEFLNTKAGCEILKRTINHVENGEAMECAREMLEAQVSLLCPSLTSTRCGDAQCQHIIHLDQLELVYEFPRGVTLDDREGIPANLYRVQTFKLGRLFLPKHREHDNHKRQNNTRQPNLYEDFNKKLNAYRALLNEFYVYVVIGIHAEDKSTVPDHLNLNMIRRGLKCYMYVGRSQYSGMPPHHINDMHSNFSKLIRRHKLNVFWMLRNFKCNSFQECEMVEAVYQVMELHIKKVSQIRNLECSNKHLECHALDFMTADQIRDVFEMVKQPHFKFLYDSVDQVPPQLNFGFLQKPLILNECRLFFY